MRAHANCLENLPIYTAVVIALLVTGASSRWLDVLAIVLLIARIARSTLHIGPKQTEMVAGARFGCYAIQIVCMIIMGVGRRRSQFSTPHLGSRGSKFCQQGLPCASLSGRVCL
jgi:uncharacterized MAPEG superfamily protein